MCICIELLVIYKIYFLVLLYGLVVCKIFFFYLFYEFMVFLIKCCFKFIREYFNGVYVLFDYNLMFVCSY